MSTAIFFKSSFKWLQDAVSATSYDQLYCFRFWLQLFRDLIAEKGEDGVLQDKGTCMFLRQFLQFLVKNIYLAELLWCISYDTYLHLLRQPHLDIQVQKLAVFTSMLQNKHAVFDINIWQGM